ncbi:MAG: hypothetical protein ACK5PP_08785 [Acidimicrobiales bacterium]
MERHVNHRGWILLRSIESGDGSLCVDLFEDPEGGFGFEHLRSDPEDGGRWSSIGGYGGARYETPSEAADAALGAVVWLADAAARRSLESWRSDLGT